MSPQLIIMLGFVALASACGKADETGSLLLVGTGLTEVMPDISKVTLLVQTTKPSATEARDEAAAATQAVVEAVAAVPGVKHDDITTLDISVAPQYSYSNSGDAKLTGYQFTQRLQVKVTNLTNEVLGVVIDEAVHAGGNLLQIDSIQADLSPALKEQATNAARVEAVENAKSSAKVLAQAGSVTLGRIKTITDSQAAVAIPITDTPAFVGNAASDAKAVATPVNIGSTEVSASVSIEWAICSA